MSRRISFTVDDARAAEVEAYANAHGYSSAGDFARVATLRIMSMYPSKKATRAMHTACDRKIAPGVPQQRQAETFEMVEDRPARVS